MDRRPAPLGLAITGRRKSGEGNCSHAQNVAQNRGVSQVPDYGHPWVRTVAGLARYALKQASSYKFHRIVRATSVYDVLNECFTALYMSL
jgi:hypothetical protein